MIDHVIPWASLLAACLAMAPLRELSEKDANRTFDVRIGERVSITLHAQLGTGYRWIARPTPRVALSERPLQGADRPGGEERQVFDVTPLAGGTAELEFDYRRSWMPDEAPARRWHVTLRIHAAGDDDQRPHGAEQP
jgi:predicted secreted protein